MIADYDGDVTTLFNIETDGVIPILATRNIILSGVISPVLIGRQQSLNLLEQMRKMPDAVFCGVLSEESGCGVAAH